MAEEILGAAIVVPDGINNFEINNMNNLNKLSKETGTIKIEESKANAKLIASAPELLDALCAVLRSYEAACPERYYSDDNVALADDVIKKAIG